MIGLDDGTWVPITLDLRVSPPAVTWLDAGETPFTEPFFQQTVERRLAAGAQLTTTGFDDLLAVGDAAGACRPPAGFIAHMSRSGSTLVANLLRALRGSRVIAEARLLNQLLAAPPDAFGAAGKDAALRAAVRALGGAPDGTCFVKFSSWNILYLPLIQAAFPTVPWVFVYRHPVEVMVANLDRPGSWMRAQTVEWRAAALTGLDPGEIAGLGPEEYCARALANFCGAALTAPPERRLLVNHRDLSPGLLSSLLEFFGCTATEEERAAMAERFQHNAKDPDQGVFTPDAAARQAAASPRVRALAEQWVMGRYEEMERLKAKG